jgi:hypothetical protein
MTDTIDVAAKAAAKELVEPALTEQSVAEQLASQARRRTSDYRPGRFAQAADQRVPKITARSL